MKKRFLSIFIVMTLVILLAACGSPAEESTGAEEGTGGEESSSINTINFKVSHPRPIGSDNDILTKDFLAEVQAALGEDRFQYEIYPNSELGDYTVVQEAVSMGDVDMTMQSVSSNVDQSLTIGTAPYLVSTWDEARQVYNSNDGIVSEYVEEALAKQNIKLLAMIPKYFNAICTTKDPQDIYNLTGNKGLKMRVPQMKSYELVAKTLGYQATPMAWSDLFTGMQTGVVDGCFGGGPEAFYSDLSEVIKYLILYRNAFEPHWLMMSMDSWNQFTAEEQEQIIKIAKDLEERAFDEAIKNDQKYIDLLEEQGVVVYDFTDEQINEIAEVVRRDVWPELEDIFGKELFDRIKSELGYD